MRLLIYWRTFGHPEDLDAEGVLAKFIAVAGVSDHDAERVKEKVFVVTYGAGSDRVWLSTTN